MNSSLSLTPTSKRERQDGSGDEEEGRTHSQKEQKTRDIGEGPDAIRMPKLKLKKDVKNTNLKKKKEVLRTVQTDRQGEVRQNSQG